MDDATDDGGGEYQTRRRQSGDGSQIVTELSGIKVEEDSKIRVGRKT